MEAANISFKVPFFFHFCMDTLVPSQGCCRTAKVSSKWTQPPRQPKGFFQLMLQLRKKCLSPHLKQVVLKSLFCAVLMTSLPFVYVRSVSVFTVTCHEKTAESSYLKVTPLKCWICLLASLSNMEF